MRALQDADATAVEDDAIGRDSRGILDPGRMREKVRFRRIDPPPELRGLVHWFWSVQWSFDGGAEFVQPVLSHPAANLSVGPASTRGLDDDAIEATAVGVCTRVDRRRLRGSGWNVAAKLAPGALGAFVSVDAVALTDRVIPMAEVTPVDAPALEIAMAAEDPDVDRQVQILGDALVAVLRRSAPTRVDAARQTAAIGALVERERSIRTVRQLSASCGLGQRSLQRLFREHAGVSPLWMIRRYRLIDAADAARAGEPPSWSGLAADLGYADQAHLSRDFKATVGLTPSQYAASVLPLGPLGD